MPAPDVTALISAAERGDELAADRLFVAVYDELRRLSQVRISGQDSAVTISATGLVHEAYLKMMGHQGWADRVHFLAVASRAMRQILIDRARARSAEKRGGSERAITLQDDLLGEDTADDVLAVNDALDVLAARNADLARVVELRFFGGLEVAEVAEVLDVSPRTAARYWARAKAHLRALLD